MLHSNVRHGRAFRKRSRGNGPVARPLPVQPLLRHNRLPLLAIIRILAAFLLPPLGVFLQVGLGLHFWLNILLTLLGFIPGIIHALWIILRD